MFSLPWESIKNFSQSVITLFFLYEEDVIRQENVTTSTLTSQEIVLIVTETCQKIFSDALAAGFDSVYIVSSAYMNSIVQVMVSGIYQFTTLLYIVVTGYRHRVGSACLGEVFRSILT